MEYAEAYGTAMNLDSILFITCILLAGWSLYNYLKTIALIVYIIGLKKNGQQLLVIYRK